MECQKSFFILKIFAVSKTIDDPCDKIRRFLDSRGYTLFRATSVVFLFVVRIGQPIKASGMGPILGPFAQNWATFLQKIWSLPQCSKTKLKCVLCLANKVKDKSSPTRGTTA